MKIKTRSKDFQKIFFSKIINKKNFTYRVLFLYLEKYLNKKFYAIDVGCGQGNITFFSAKKIKKIAGIDISKENIKVAKRKARKLNLNKKISFSTGNIENLSIPKIKPT